MFMGPSLHWAGHRGNLISMKYLKRQTSQAGFRGTKVNALLTDLQIHSSSRDVYQTFVDRDAESTSEESKHWEESRPAAGTGLSNNFKKAEGLGHGDGERQRELSLLDLQIQYQAVYNSNPT